jgi:hypothetical protein
MPTGNSSALSGCWNWCAQRTALPMWWLRRSGLARTILKNSGGEEKSVDELRQLIRTTYGIEPAKSLDQMLYKRASAGRGFYKTTDGKFGLTELPRGVAIDDVPLPSAALV